MLLEIDGSESTFALSTVPLIQMPGVIVKGATIRLVFMKAVNQLTRLQARPYDKFSIEQTFISKIAITIFMRHAWNLAIRKMRISKLMI